MEDPWASGSAWASDTKPAPKTPTPPASPPIASPTPPRNLDVSDPWGAPTPVATAGQTSDKGLDWSDSGHEYDRDEDQTRPAEAAGWGGGWGGSGNSETGDHEPIAGPSRSPPHKPQDSPEWGISGPSLDAPDIQDSHTLASDAAALADDLRPTSPLASPPVDPQFSLPLSPASPVGIDSPRSRLPQSPSFGDDFGGFSSGFGDDPWGGKKEDTGWDRSSERSASSSGRSRSSPRGDGGPEDGWAGASSGNKRESLPAQKSGMDDDWEEAQQRIRIAEQRAPREKIESMQADWRGLINALIGDYKLESPDEGAEQEHDDRLRRQAEQIAETLRSLSTLPPDTNTYPPVLSSFETYERYQYALKRPNTVPETSLLNMPLGRRSRRVDSALDNLDSWTSRSRLGEPEAPQPENSQQAEETRSKWSFWRKPTAEKQLVTSGGGVLEVKSASPAPAPAPITIEPRPSIGSANSKSSRPASPAPSVLSAAADSTPTAPSTATSPPPPAPGPSAVSRFFGRLSRRQTSQSISSVDKGDMEFSADDFSFLDQVPSMSTPDREKAVGDLLTMEGGRTEEMASLESMLRSKPTPLPAPLAPPPMASRTPSSSRFPSNPTRPDMDLLSGLDFDGPGSSVAQTARHASGVSSIDRPTSSAWDDFLTSGPSSGSVAIAGPSSSIAPPSDDMPRPTKTPSQPNRAIAPGTHAPLSSYAQPPPRPASQSDFDDFADFATPPLSDHTKHESDDFDDFGDFGGFTNAHPTATRPSQSTVPRTLQSAPTSDHAKRSSLDHTLTLNLLSGASATKGKQWPAPPSPLAPSLEPPPKAPNAVNHSANFPFISPPPGSTRPAGSGLGDLMNEDFGGPNSSQGSGSVGRPAIPPVRVQSPPMAPSVPMQPTRTASPIVPASNMPISRPGSTAPATKSGQQQTQTQSGLSAQDLSFFDSL